MNALELMTPEPITVDSSASLEDARELMVRNQIHELPVVDGVQLVGIITERDLRGALGSGEDAAEAALARPIAEVMTADVEVVSQDTSAAEVCRVLAGLGVRSVPVVGGNLALVGIVSVTDVLSAAAERFEQDES